MSERGLVRQKRGDGSTILLSVEDAEKVIEAQDELIAQLQRKRKCVARASF